MYMHSYIKLWFSATLALIVLVASIGIALDFHVCQGKIKSIGVFEKATACSSMGTNTSCDKSIKFYRDGFSQESCCRNNLLLCKINIENSNPTISENNVYNPMCFYIEDNIKGNVIIPSTTIGAIPLLRPPPIEKDFSILFQTFLI